MEAMQARRARALFYAFLACLLGFGIALISVGSKSMSATSGYSHWMHSADASAPVLAIVSGCGILVVTALGFVCALKEINTGLLVFAGILGAFTIIEIVGGALAATGSARSTTSLQQRMEDSMQRYPTNDEHKRAWDEVQTEMHCCGALESRQWRDVYPGKAPPVSCCPERDSKLTVNTRPADDRRTPPSGFCQPKDQIFRRGCYRPLSSNIKSSLDEVAYVCLIFSFFQIFVIALASYLAYTIKRERDLKEAVVDVLKESGESALSRRTAKDIPIATITAPTS